MLTSLTVKNYALIRQLELGFNTGFTVITGETGAGKSILLGALDLIRGKRADTRMMLDKKSKCIVEGAFEIKGYKLKPFFEKYDLDYDDFTVLRRELTTYGKSRAFINDTPVTLSVLAEFSALLLDVHAQEETSNMNEVGFQFEVLDGFSGLTDDVNEYRKQYTSLSREKKKLVELEEQSGKIKTEQDYIEFLLDELNNAKLKAGEQEDLEKELKLLEHAEEIRTVLYQSHQIFEDEQQGILDQIRQIISSFQKLSALDAGLENLMHRLEAAQIEISDVSQEIKKYEGSVVVDPGKTEVVKDRLSFLYSLQQKHHVGTMDKLVDRKNELEEKIGNIDDLEKTIDSLKQSIAVQENRVINLAKQISEQRIKSIPSFEKELVTALSSLGMPEGRFKVNLQNGNEPGRFGTDKLTFLFNANKGGQLHELVKVASGGEKSRLMLAMKSRISKKALLPTLIFDEVDAGVSGVVADKVGELIRSLADTMQVIAITHLPQIAGKGNHHFQVYKSSTDDSTITDVKELAKDERVNEIAKLLSGKEVTGASLESARQLLDQ